MRNPYDEKYNDKFKKQVVIDYLKGNGYLKLFKE